MESERYGKWGKTHKDEGDGIGVGLTVDTEIVVELVHGVDRRHDGTVETCLVSKSVKRASTIASQSLFES